MTTYYEKSLRKIIKAEEAEITDTPLKEET